LVLVLFWVGGCELLVDRDCFLVGGEGLLVLAQVPQINTEVLGVGPRGCAWRAARWLISCRLSAV